MDAPFDCGSSVKVWEQSLGHLVSIDIEGMPPEILINPGLDLADAKALQHSVGDPKPVQVQDHLNVVESLCQPHSH